MKRLFEKLKMIFARQPRLQQPVVSGSGLRLVRYKSQLYIDCANLFLKNGFIQEGDYCFIRNYKGNPYGSEPKFFLYHFYSDGLCLNTYNPKQDFILIKNKEDMQKQIDRLTDGSLA